MPAERNNDRDEEERPSLISRLLPAVIGIAILLSLAGGVAYVLSGKSKPMKPPELVQTVKMALLPPPPPPPPPPKEQIKHLDQLKKDDLAPVNPNPTPTKAPNNPAPPGPPLGAPLGAGTDGFGMAGGGGDGGSGGGGPGGKGYGPFVQAVQDKIRAALSGDEVTSAGSYHTALTLWRDENGKLLRCRLAMPTGNEERDRRICDRTMQITDLPQNPPDQIGKPITIKITSTQANN